MSDDLRSVVERMDVRLGYHEREIESLKAAQRDVNEWLQRIQKTLDKMLWLASGAAITYLANTFGITEVIKSLVL